MEHGKITLRGATCDEGERPSRKKNAFILMKAFPTTEWSEIVTRR